MIFGVLQTVQLVRKNWLIFDLHISIYSPTGSKKLMIFDGYPKNNLIFNILSYRLKRFNCYCLMIWLTLDDPHIVPTVQKLLWLGTILFYCFKKVVKFWLITHMECYWFRNFNDIWLIFQRFIWCWTYSSTGYKSLMRFKILFNDRHLILWFKNI